MIAPRTSSRSRRLLFTGVTVVLALGLVGALLTAWNVRQIREWLFLRKVLYTRLGSFTLGALVRNDPPEWREHLRTCYKEPQKIDLDKISWNLLCRPTPFLGYAPIPGTQDEGTFNAQQLRDSRDLRLPKPAGVYRIFLVGGSLVYGVGAPSQDRTISAYLERMLNERVLWPGRRVEVFNAGVCGWTSTHERILIENRLSEWAPDMVLALTGANEIHWGFQRFNVLDQRTYEDQMYLELINSSLRRVRVAEYGSQPSGQGPQRVAPAVVAGRFVKNIRLAAAALESAGARYVVALQPLLTEQAKPLSPGERWWLTKREDPEKRNYIALCYAAMSKGLGEPLGGVPSNLLAKNPANMDVVDVQDVFAKRSDPIFLDQYHMADKGNEILARRLADELQKLEARRGGTAR